MGLQYSPDFRYPVGQVLPDFVIASASEFHICLQWAGPEDWNPGGQEPPIFSTTCWSVLLVDDMGVQKSPEGRYPVGHWPLTWGTGDWARATIGRVSKRLRIMIWNMGFSLIVIGWCREGEMVLYGPLIGGFVAILADSVGRTILNYPEHQ